MKSIEIKSSKREKIGKVDSKSLRKNGSVPCVLYGGKETIHFSATEISFKDLVYTGAAHTVTLDFGGKKTNAILQDIQFHPLSDRIIHADFYETHEDKEVTMEIPVEIKLILIFQDEMLLVQLQAVLVLRHTQVVTQEF